MKKVLEELDINHEQLICLGILCGTDYNPGGVKGLGPKKSLKFVKEYETKEEIFKAVEENEKLELDFDWEAIYEEIENPKVDKEIKIEFPKVDKEKIKEILMEYEFSEGRIDNQLGKFEELKKVREQRTLF